MSTRTLTYTHSSFRLILFSFLAYFLFSIFSNQSLSPCSTFPHFHPFLLLLRLLHLPRVLFLPHSPSLSGGLSIQDLIKAV